MTKDVERNTLGGAHFWVVVSMSSTFLIAKKVSSLFVPDSDNVIRSEHPAQQVKRARLTRHAELLFSRANQIVPFPRANVMGRRGKYTWGLALLGHAVVHSFLRVSFGSGGQQRGA